MNNKYIQECTNCGNVIVGREKRGFIRDALNGGPGTAVEFIPVGGKTMSVTKKVVIKDATINLDITFDEVNANVAFKV